MGKRFIQGTKYTSVLEFHRIQKMTDMVSGLIFQLTFKKRPLVAFWCRIKEECPKLSEKTIKILLPFPATSLRPDFLHILQQKNTVN